MGMSLGSNATQLKQEINVTPLVDVVFVLLIIFMSFGAVQEMMHPVTIPDPAPSTPAPERRAPADALILRLDAAGHSYLNREPISPDNMKPTLTALLAGRQDKMVYLAADGELSYDRVAQFLDLARASGAREIGVVLEDLE